MTDRRLPPDEPAGSPDSSDPTPGEEVRSPLEAELPLPEDAPGRWRAEGGEPPRSRAPRESDPATEALARVIAGLRRRAWIVHGGTAALAFVVVAIAVVAVASLALGLGAPSWVRGPAAILLLAGAGAAGFWAWRRAGRPRDVELARALEDRDRHAAGLTTAVELASLLPLAERNDLGAPPFSPELARAHVETTSARVREAGVERAFDLTWLKRAGTAAAVSVLGLGLALFLAGPVSKGLGRLALGEHDGGATRTEPKATPITGDISLTYIYPAHTGLPSKTITGTNGEITAPPGTRVHLETRADRDLAKAYIDLAGASLPMQVAGRQLQGDLLVQKSGTYAFRFEDDDGDEIARGPEIPITATEDGVPTISITAPVAEMTVTEKDQVEVRFEAADDFGVAKVELVYKIGPADEQVLTIASYGEARKRTDGSWLWEMAPLSLHPGEVISYYLRASDNDAVGGAKVGQSRTQTLKIFSEAEHRRELVAKVEEAWEKMVLALGDRIAPREGPRRVSGEERVAAGAAADEQVVQVGLSLQDVGGQLAKDERAPEELTAAVLNISRRVLDKSQNTRSARARARGRGATFLTQLDSAEGAEQQELESSVLYLEALLDRQRILQIEELAQELASSRRDLANLLEEYRNAPSDQAKAKALRELARLKQRMAELMQRMAELGKGIQDEHLNAEAMEALAKERDLMSQLDDVQKLLGEGKIDEALAQLQQLGMQMDEMAKSLSDAADNQAENDPALKELAQDLQQYEQELGQLRQDQEQLSQATEQLKREQAKKLQEEMSRNGQRILDELKAKVDQAQSQLAKVPEEKLQPRLTEDLGGAKERLQDLESSLAAKDFDAALESAARALAHAEGLEGELSRENDFARRFGMPESGAIDEALQQSSKATPLVAEVKKKLEELFSKPQMSPEQRQQMQRLAQRQQQLGERMNQLKQQAEKIGQKAPIFDEGAQQAMQGAQGSMGEASAQLEGNNPGGALASERRAGEQLQSLEQSLQKSKQQARNNRGGSGFPLPMASGGGRGDRGSQGDFDEHEKVAIPGADQYKAPEEFRKDILDAMKKDAPKGFEEGVREYYEEIVK